MTHARFALLFAACAASVATSAVHDPPPPVLNGLTILHNGGSESLTVEVSMPLAPANCDLFRDHPELLSTVSWFEPDPIVMAPMENRALEVAFDTVACQLARVTVPGEGSRIVFAHADDFVFRSFPMDYPSLSEVDTGVLVLVGDTPNQVFRPTSVDLAYEEGDPLPTCRDIHRPVHWETRADGLRTITSIAETDDCQAWTLDDGDVLTVCVAPELLSFEAGDRIRVQSDGEILNIDRLDPDTLERVENLFVTRSAARVPFGLGVANLGEAPFECIATEGACEVVGSPGYNLLSTAADHGFFEVGEIAEVQLDPAHVGQVWVNHASMPLSANCLGGLEMVVVSWLE